MEDLAKQISGDASLEQKRALIEALLSGRVSSIFDNISAEPRPEVRPAPATPRGFRIRIDLKGTKPPVWRRLELPGDLTLPKLHEVIQVAMGWTDSHLHQFRTGSDRRAPRFVTHFDLEEGDDGVLEDDVRLDQLVAHVGDVIGYSYDFGDDWDHVIKVESVLDVVPTDVQCTDGRLACPPEDCGGIGGYREIADWVRSSYQDALLPDVFESADHAHGWLPENWHPDSFDLEQVNADLTVVSAEPVAVATELAELVARLQRHGIRSLRQTLARPTAHGPIEVTPTEAARLTAAYRVFLDVIGDGVSLTTAGYLPPAVVEQVAERSGITGWWIGKANREDLTPPVAEIRDTARALGLVTVRKGRLSPTAAAKRVSRDPQAMWRHIVARLPLGTSDSDRQAGWLALAVVASGTTTDQWRFEVSDLLYDLGWRSGGNRDVPPPAHSPTYDVLRQLVGESRTGWRIEGSDPAVAATARAVIRG